MLGAEGDDGEAAETAGAFCRAQSPGGFEGVADGWDAAGESRIEEGSEDSREEVGVLVRIDMGDTEAGVLEAADLGSGFGGDFRCANAEGEEVADEGGKGWPERRAVGAEGGDLFRRESGGSVDEEDVAADFELWIGVGDGDGVVKEGPGGHESGGGERAGAMEFDDGAVDAGGEAEVVGVGDEGHVEQRTAFSDQRSVRLSPRWQIAKDERNPSAQKNASASRLSRVSDSSRGAPGVVQLREP